MSSTEFSQSRRPVARNLSILGLTAAELVSPAGTEVTWLAVPWFVLQTTGSVAKMGLVFAVEVAPTIILGIPSGAVIQRYGARKTMLACDLARAPLLALLPFLNASGSLSFGLLLLIVAASGVFTSPYLACQRVILPEIVGEDEAAVGQANTVVGAASTVGTLGGAAIGGLLIAAIGPMKVVWIDSVSYLVAFLIVLTAVRTRHRGAEEVPEPGLFAGLRYVVRDPFLRGVALVVLLSGFWYPVLVVSIPVYAYEHGNDPRIAGWLFAALSAGLLVGSVVSYRALAQVEPVRLARFAIVWIGLTLCVLVFRLPVAAVASVLALSALLVPSANAPAFTFLTLAPEGVRAKVTTAVLTANTAIMPLGYLVGGAVIVSFGLQTAFGLVGACAIATAAIFWLVSKTARARGQGSPRSIVASDAASRADRN